MFRHFRIYFRAAAAGRPCQQPPRAGRAGSRRGPAVPAAAAGRAGSRGPTCAGQSIGRKLRRSRSPPGTASQPCRRKEVGVAWGKGVGRVSWNYALSPIRGTCGRGPFAACTGRRARTGTSALRQRSVRARGAARVRAERRACARARALSGACVHACALSGARACARAERSGARRGARGSTVHARGATRSVSSALVHPQCPKL
jgi:hypothetical protein